MKFFLKSIKGFVIALLLVSLLGGVMGIRKAYAAEDEAAPPPLPSLMERAKELPLKDTPKTAVDTQELVDRVARLSTYVNKIFNPAIHFITFKIGGLLNNDYIYAGNMGEMLHNIWRVSRNMVNIAFVLILLYLALKHIFSGEGESTDLKKVLPTFAIMLIAVNFSWLASKVVLDAAKVVTNITFSIPAAVKGVVGDELTDVLAKQCEFDEKGNPKSACFPSKIYNPTDTQFVLHAKADECNEDIDQKYQEAYPEGKEPDKSKPFYGKAIYCWKTIDLGDYNQNSASYFLSFSMAKVQNLTQASGTDIGKVAIGTIFAILIQLVYLVAFGSLLIALILRIAVLWFFVAFSPLIVLLLFLKKNLAEASFESDKLSLSTFTHWAFAPAFVGAVWAVGFIMVTTGQSMSADFFEKLNETGEVSGKIFEIETLFMGMENIQQFIWLLMTVGIIWVGTFAVLTKLKFADQLFSKINTAGRNFAGLVAQSPTWAPIVPLYDHKTGEFKGMSSVKKTLEGLNFNKKMYEFSHDMTPGESDKFTEGAKKLATAIKNTDKQTEVDKISEGDVALKFVEIHSGISETTLRDMLKRNKEVVQTMLTTGLDKDRGARLFSLLDKHFTGPKLPPPAAEKSAAAAPAPAATAAPAEKAADLPHPGVAPAQEQPQGGK